VAAFLRGREAEVYFGPFDVRLSKYFKEDVEIATVVQPDLTIVCNADILDERGCIGIPDIIADVLAPRKAVVEFKNKYDVYEESGVKEYWIVDPSHQTVQVNILVDGKYVPGRILSEGDIVTTDILPGFSLNIEKLFAE
jgi:Uma2 family endonuclease